MKKPDVGKSAHDTCVERSAAPVGSEAQAHEVQEQVHCGPREPWVLIPQSPSVHPEGCSWGSAHPSLLFPLPLVWAFACKAS